MTFATALVRLPARSQWLALACCLAPALACCLALALALVIARAGLADLSYSEDWQRSPIVVNGHQAFLMTKCERQAKQAWKCHHASLPAPVVAQPVCRLSPVVCTARSQPANTSAANG